MTLLGGLARALGLALEILNDASVWLVASFVLAGLLHSLLSPERLQRHLGNRRLSSLGKATASGVLLPVCSCGVVPLGLGLYYSGAYLGPTLAFLTATPIINPAAVLLAYGLLGWKIATIYLVAGFVVPLVAGLAGNWLAGPELRAPGLENASAADLDPGRREPLGRKLVSGLRWGFLDLGVMTSKYILIGVGLAGAIIALTPQAAIQRYLGDPGLISLLGIALLGAIMYVCAVGHIPFVAALVATGAAPGVAITFLMTGPATNLPELLAISRLIGKRAVAIYAGVLILVSLAFGWLTNLLLADNFVPLFAPDASSRVLGAARIMTLAAPEPLAWAASAVIGTLGLWPLASRLRRRFTRVEAPA